MNRQSHTTIAVILFFLLFSTLLVVGILLGYWIGLGWFFLVHTVSVLFASSPRLYIPVVRLLIDKESGERLQERLSRHKGQWFVPKSAIALNLFNLLLTAFVFLKINIPLHDVFAAFFSR